VIGTLAAEALALATGIFPKHAPSVAEVKRAATLHGRLEAAFKKFLTQEEPEEYEWELPPEQGELHRQLLEPLEGDEWAPLHVPPEIFGQWLIIINRARKYIADKWPIYPAEGLTPANYELDSSELGDVWELVRALDGLDGIIGDLKSHTLSPAQMAAFSECFPDFYAVAVGGDGLDEGEVPLLFSLLVGMLKSEQEITADQEDMIRVLQKQPDQEPILVTQPQPAPQSKKPAQASAEKESQSTMTRTEVLESKQQRGK